MESFCQLYNQYALYKKKSLVVYDSQIATDLLGYGINQDYYHKVYQSVELLHKLYDSKLTNDSIRSYVEYKLNDHHADNVKFCILIDVFRCYDGLNHPTTITKPEGIALLLLLDKMIGNNELLTYGQLKTVSPSTLSLIDLVPFISECSEQIGSRYSLFLPLIFKKKAPYLDNLYRRLLYNLCKTIAEVDGEISVSEKEWLNEIALLNDDDPNNDIDISSI